MNLNRRQPVALKAVMFILLFLAFTAALVVANYLVSTGKDPYTSLSERLHPSFYYRTVIILLVSSLLYTPFSYGISKYFIESTKRVPRFKDIFFMLKKPVLFVKAVALRLLVWITRGLYQVLTLAFGVIAQGFLYILMLAWKGQNVLNMSIHSLLMQIEQAIVNREFIYFSVFLWVIILFVFLLFYIRFIFCKYALLRYEELGVLEAMKIGLFATRGRMLATLKYYLSYFAYYVLLFATFGLLYVFLKPYRTENFSTYAVRQVEEARGAYFLWKNKKKP